ncbi:MAG: GntR family transcriptional regulator [Candidatus Brocadiia bacterium]
MRVSAQKQAGHITADELAEKLQERMDSGQLQPGDRLPTFRDLRDRYGAATNTISRAYDFLEGKDLVRRVRGSGVYVAEPDTATARWVVGCYGRGFSGATPYWLECINGIRGAATEYDIDIMLLPEIPQNVSLENSDGFIVSQPLNSNLPHAASDKPTVSLLYQWPGMRSVIADDYLGAQNAVSHLVKLGHEKIASLMIDSDNQFGEKRFAGYLSGLRKSRIEPSPQWSRPCEGAFGEKSFTQIAEENMNRWLSQNWENTGCTAILGYNDEVAIGIVHALMDHGLSVPEDVSVVGFDGTQVARHCYPPLTTVKVPLSGIGRRCLETLSQQLNGSCESTPDETAVLSTKLIEGKSTAPPPA